MAVRLCTNLVLLNRIHPLVAVLLKCAPSGIAISVAEEHKRIGQLPNDGRMGEVGKIWRRVACTRILLRIDQRGLLPICQRIGSTKNQHRHQPPKRPAEISTAEELTHPETPWVQLPGQLADQGSNL